MFFSQAAQSEYLEVSFLQNEIASIDPSNGTILSIQSKVVSRIVTTKAVEGSDDNRSVDMLLRENVLPTDKDGISQLELRQSYIWTEGATNSSLMRESRNEWKEPHSKTAFKKAAAVTLVPTITILSISTHGSKKRPRGL